jgi:NAD(P)-dependent dehydrogenase (short-subunit alcohol dehydrogenase family)
MEATRPLARRLEGRVALITGAASGIGAATAARLADEGALLVLTEVREQADQTLTARLRERGSGAVVLGREVEGEEGWVIAVAAALSEFGRLDVLVNSAGLVSTDRTGILLGMRVAAEALKSSGHGSVIDIRYPLGYGLGPFGALGTPPVCAPHQAQHWAPDGVRVNYLHPGFFDTQLPARRPSGTRQLEHLAACVAFLASDDASFITGLELFLNA